MKEEKKKQAKLQSIRDGRRRWRQQTDLYVGSLFLQSEPDYSKSSCPFPTSSRIVEED